MLYSSVISITHLISHYIYCLYIHLVTCENMSLLEKNELNSILTLIAKLWLFFAIGQVIAHRMWYCVWRSWDFKVWLVSVEAFEIGCTNFKQYNSSFLIRCASKILSWLQINAQVKASFVLLLFGGLEGKMSLCLDV